MPTQTFFNLPEDKRERVIEAALEELSRESFKNASVAAIIENAGIPRGSFYQYFSDLKDLYKYLFVLVGQKKIAYLTEARVQIQGADYLHVIRALYAAGIRFAGEHPKYARLGANFYREDQSFRREIMGEMEGMSLQYFEDLLRSGQEKGEVAKNVDLKIAAFLFHTINIAIVEYVLQQHGPEYLFEQESGFLELADKVLYIIGNGLNKR